MKNHFNSIQTFTKAHFLNARGQTLLVGSDVLGVPTREFLLLTILTIPSKQVLKKKKKEKTYQMVEPSPRDPFFPQLICL